ncbi:MAG: holo-ACP synthase [Gammaproteobacteria bacterium]
MIVGIGVDIVEVARIRSGFARFGMRLARRILAEEELALFERARNAEKFLAMRFAAKEAASKALGTGFRRGVSPGRIAVRHAPSGKPSLAFSPALAPLLAELEVGDSHVSMADEREYAIAYVVLERQAARR